MNVFGYLQNLMLARSYALSNEGVRVQALNRSGQIIGRPPTDVN